MQSFASHALHCPRCAPVCRTYRANDTLCGLGHVKARDVAQYIYNRDSQPFSVTDRSHTGDHIQVEVPSGCEAVRGLLKAIDQGLRVRGKNDRMGLAASQRQDRHMTERTASSMKRISEAKNLEKPSRQNRGTRHIEGRDEAYHGRRQDGRQQPASRRHGITLLLVCLGSLFIEQVFRASSHLEGRPW